MVRPEKMRIPRLQPSSRLRKPLPPQTSVLGALDAKTLIVSPFAHYPASEEPSKPSLSRHSLLKMRANTTRRIWERAVVGTADCLAIGAAN